MPAAMLLLFSLGAMLLTPAVLYVYVTFDSWWDMLPMFVVSFIWWCCVIRIPKYIKKVAEMQ